jgi:hypothetical protein
VLVTFGAAAVGGADLMLDVELFVVVDEEELPDSYVVDVVYPPVIEVFDPDVLFCVVSAHTHVVIKNNINNVRTLPPNLMLLLLLFEERTYLVKHLINSFKEFKEKFI